ncbi:MAG: arylesterase [Spirochaetia bacterium]|nr:arylesterase [Spirochaetia bacterium]
MRTSLLLLTICFSGVLLSTATCKKEESKPTLTRSEPAIVFLGDSLSAGLGLPEELTFPYLIQEKIDAAGLKYRVINAGRSGDTTAGGLSRLQWYLRKDVKLKILIIELGSNDAMRGQPPESIEKNLTEIIRKTRAYDPTVKILMYQFYTFPNLGKVYGDKFLQIFPRIAKKEKVELLAFPLEGVAGKPELNQADGIHPNPKGSPIVANNVWKSLKPHL